MKRSGFSEMNLPFLIAMIIIAALALIWVVNRISVEDTSVYEQRRISQVRRCIDECASAGLRVQHVRSNGLDCYCGHADGVLPNESLP